MMDKVEIIYNMYKDVSIGARKFRIIAKDKYKLTEQEITNIYIRINNYQIKKYGQRMGRGDFIEYQTTEEKKRISKSRNAVRKRKLRGY